MATAMVANGVTSGPSRCSGKSTGPGVFEERDRELLEGMAATAAIALRNAHLHTAEKRARDLALLLEISREITATLDLDRVLQSVVNLAGRALPFDRGAVALYDKGGCEIRAVAGQEKVDPDDPQLQDLVARAEWAAGRGEPLYLSRRDEPASDAERLFVNFFAVDLERDQVQSALYLPLRDEEGVLGVLLFESQAADFAGAYPAGAGLDPRQPDRGRPAERAALPSGPDGGCARGSRRPQAGAAGAAAKPGAIRGGSGGSAVGSG